MLPPPIIPGKTTLGVVAPASAVKDPSRLHAGVEYLRTLGFKLKQGRTAYSTEGYLSGTDTERADELNRFLRDPEVDALICVRGGYGCLRILPSIDYEAAQSYPKIVVGYSDITALQLALFARAGVPSISGPMVSTEWADSNPESEALFLQLASGGTPSPLLSPTGTPLRPMRNGSVTGYLLGGNLAVLVRMIGSPYLPSLKGSILFIEDIGESAYRIDGMLAHLKLSGVWDSLGGLVLGQFTEDTSPERTSEDIASVFTHYCSDAPFPVATGLIYGHIPMKNSIPIGVKAQLSVTDTAASLHMLEPVVSPPPQV